MEIIVGIDLGTTNSEIAILRDESKPEVIPVEGEMIMPSCVGIDPEGRLIVGRTAKNQMVSHPENTVLSIKRRMGENATVTLGGKSFSPEEISSFILARMKSEAEKYLGHPIAKAVITVPAYFDDAQRNATKDAGVLAGLDVVRIINEPTAAALAYEAGHEENQRILVYDLGGGTFDVSLVVVENGIVEVKASHGDTHLGGDDFDRLLIDYVTKRFKEQHGVDLKSDLRATNRLWVAVEKAKCTLSDRPFAGIREEFIVGNHHLDMEISRDDYEETIRPMLRKTMDTVHACLTDSLFLPKAIDKIILVGGATRTPLVSQMLQEDMGIEPHHEISPDLIVSMGAAIQGAAISGVKTKSILVDITPYTFGTRAVGEHEGMMTDDMFVPVIKRNSSLPVSKEELFYTYHDNQEKILVEIFQGDDPLASDNIFIGDFWIKGLSKARAGSPILLNLELDINGILKVTAKEKTTGLSKTVTMDTTKKGNVSNLEERRRNIAAFLEEDEDAGGEADAFSSDIEDKQNLIVRAKGLRKRAEGLLSTVNEEDAAELSSILEQSRHAIAAQDWETVARLNESLSDMLFYLED
ncbi:MAG: heat-shock protein Hsp70 [Deltaproteobacteria bacterium CG12_big_fil_rev_8_21_14_0_65_43_10]|nr:MAG: heat-shock protein Hsp70 [Deltaproteobacteria bacterium CG2_30_43_15]PIQ45536.1 MAG: heat-shock protein Hsp70 [Deltaproteobacteria bacterium CG12_big_fil_rev_8_21_14_0_65_43_10]PIU85665.1 MAG: heat-shock protein Hsp70 [Deltaproteobacteria bacterium CG06_land_8_20_14_3_00_44_19]PIX26793.1 MAG: heat-shock protein Hsp70 [Deltaproteobacteria bacterium CG_4_8_14_3_um_filter_43_13]PIZ18984.1 MAG: heat-shock protein Hsp70 [Deltaproteobacteria bacterium CG_4_10_14_0_8_um_filter_43_12]PJB44940.